MSSALSCSRSLLFLCLLLSSFSYLIHGEEEASAVGVIKIKDIKHLLPSSNCSAGHGSHNGNNTLSMWYAYGPCSPFGGNTTRLLTLEEMMENDKLRVAFLSQKWTITSNNTTTPMEQVLQSKSTLPTYSGRSWGFLGFVVVVGLGSPAVKQVMHVDTGSDLTWVHCIPCGNTNCHKQRDPLFDPRRSKTYGRFPCHDPLCEKWASSVCTKPGNLCQYEIEYGDESSTVGLLSKDTLILTPSDVFQNFVFGCAHVQSGFDGDLYAGLIGLARSPFSLIQQTASKFGRVFSYCVPSSPSSRGHLTFGASLKSADVHYTPMLAKPHLPWFYFLQLKGIGVGGKLLDVPSTAYAATQILIDSGTSVTRLPSTIYVKLRSTFRSYMGRYGQVMSNVSPLDTCYDITGQIDVSVPSMHFHFAGVSLHFQGENILYVKTESRRTYGCLAFLPMEPGEKLAIFGYIQQKGFEVVHDLERNRLGFAIASCDA